MIRYVVQPRRRLLLTIGRRPLSTQGRPSIFRRIKDDIDDAESRGVLPNFGPKPNLANWFATSTFQLLYFYATGIFKVLRRRTDLSRTPTTRREWRMLRTQHRDMSKIAPFCVLLLDPIILPFVIFLPPSFLPSTIILPGQLRRQHAAHIQSVKQALPDLRKAYKLLERLKIEPFVEEDDDEDEHDTVLKGVKVDDKDDFWFHRSRRLAICHLYGLPAFQSIPVPPLGIESHMEFLEEDDAWLVKDGLDGLGPDEVREAVNERGLCLVSETEAASLLRWWLDHVATGSNDQRLKAALAFSALYKPVQDGD
ncbi:uncharacterized protein BT62DRAFT_1000157 [Guyanagaster necrorhizus]|uniref:Letm1 RBD domain-containing protein n=1 Tax=Guyanagaster necrorhizus TaxID=856835 RepID=A0A9P7W1K5_9AGAR|nr:uncharacterized protein BT62DRAFT_1000157 [Guyanagaster necrorhizus MCA 3950]KAG7450932.1 hypothetical protein BT62DRAFT_1000157 [Guyanagaster necrorhizus MCA 3950]